MDEKHMELLLRRMPDLARLFLEDRRADHEIAQMALAGENLEGRKRQHVRRRILAAKLAIETLHLPARNERDVEAERRLGVTRGKSRFLPQRRRG